MALSVKFVSVEIKDPKQSGPVTVEIRVVPMTDQADVASLTGTSDLDAYTVRATAPRAAAAAFLAQCTVTNKAEIPAALLALLSPPLTVP